ncbi:MAG: hypothetical protein EON87_00930 [Brevundimonas sp.]|nr:MAG: hypothetical protein EON87_00930 [Brevundimonas sp.]
MRIKITAGGIFDGEGKEIPVGSEFDIADPETGADGEPLAPHPWVGRYETIGESKKGKTPVTNPAGGGNDEPPVFVAPVGPFAAKESSPGWWAIFDGKDQPVGKKARKAELDGFDTLSDDDKLEFATQHAKAAFDADQKKA